METEGTLRIGGCGVRKEKIIRKIQVYMAGEDIVLLSLYFTDERMEQNGTIKKCFL